MHTRSYILSEWACVINRNRQGKLHKDSAEYFQGLGPQCCPIFYSPEWNMHVRNYCPGMKNVWALCGQFCLSSFHNHRVLFPLWPVAPPPPVLDADSPWINYIIQIFRKERNMKTRKKRPEKWLGKRLEGILLWVIWAVFFFLFKQIFCAWSARSSRYKKEQ